MPMTRVNLYGHLGEKFGKSYEFDVVTPQEAINALRANFPGFLAHLYAHNKPGYWIFVGGENTDLDGLGKPAGRKTIQIVPVIEGAKKNPIWTILIGVALIAIAGPLGAGIIGTAVMGIGVSMALTGISELIAGNPDGGPEEAGENKPSTFFSGPVNTTQQGSPVPIVYGEVLAGSGVISAGISTEAAGADGSLTADDENCIQSNDEAAVCSVPIT